MNEMVIETSQLTKVYGEQMVVDQMSLHVKSGRIYGLLGRNGAGKTTIMKMILGLTPITSGEVKVFGQDVQRHGKKIYPRIGAIIETPGFYPNLTGTENLEIFARLRGTAQPNAVKEALEVVGLPYKDKKAFGKYSLGIIRLYDLSWDVDRINKELVMRDVSVKSAYLCNDSLEDYFKKITGGEGIA